jgi:hypothetical protein
VGYPEKERTGLCFLERKVALRKWRKTDPVVFWLRRARLWLGSGLPAWLRQSDRLFFGYFLLEEQKKVT